MVHVYYCHTETLPDPKTQPSEYRDLSSVWMQKILSYSVPKDRLERAGAALLLTHVLSEIGLDVNDVFFSERGKPLHPAICFSYAHSENLVVLAVSSKPIGCDVEKIRRIPRSVLRRFTASERSWIGEDAYAFFRIWTGKESYVKYTGEGLRIYRDVCVDTNRFAIIRNNQSVSCRLQEYTFGNYVCTICSEEDEFAPPQSISLLSRK